MGSEKATDRMTKDNNDAADNASDIAFVKALADVLADKDLGELEVERSHKGTAKLHVRISKHGYAAPAPVYAAAPAPAASAAAPVAPAAPTVAATSEDPAKLPGAVTSPMVGTAYLSPEPTADAFVKVGDTVTEGQTLLIIEAMKTMNHIPATKAGTVKRILIEDGAAVEYGAPLMIVE